MMASRVCRLFQTWLSGMNLVPILRHWGPRPSNGVKFSKCISLNITRSPETYYNIHRTKSFHGQLKQFNLFLEYGDIALYPCRRSRDSQAWRYTVRRSFLLIWYHKNDVPSCLLDLCYNLSCTGDVKITNDYFGTINQARVVSSITVNV